MPNLPAPDLAVVIVNYNAGEHLERCVASVLASGGGAHCEIVVVDNDSHDGSAQAAVAAHPEARLIETEENRGFSAGVNVGIGATTAPWILVLNPDAEVWAGTLAGMVKVAEDRPRVGLIGCLIRNADGTPYPTGRVFPSIGMALGHAFLGPIVPDNRFSRAYTMAGWDRASEREVDWVSGSCMLFRRRALDEVGWMDERFFLYGEEVDVARRLRDAGWGVLFTPELEVIHEGGVSTGRSRWTHVQHSRGVYQYFAKHRADGWGRALLPFAWVALRARAELVSLRDRGRKA